MRRHERHWVGRLQELVAGGTPYETVIDLSVGQPDGLPPAAVAEALAQAQVGESAHEYPEALGSPALRGAISEWLRTRLGLSFAPAEIVVTHGAKLAVALVPVAFTEPGDVVVVPTPGYPTYSSGPNQLGRDIRWLALKRERRYEPTRADLERAFEGARLAFLSYPSNPTGMAGSDQVFEAAVAVARRTGTLVVHDAAYMELTHDGRARSIFSVPGADDVALELHSFSKSFHLAGYRVGFALGRGNLVRELGRVVGLYDSGATRISQHVAEAALRRAPDFAQARRERDRRRTGAVASGLAALGCDVVPPDATFYVWFRPPRVQREAGVGWEAVVRQAGIACAPGEAFGPEGAGWIRLACVHDESVYDEVLERLRRLWGW